MAGTQDNQRDESRGSTLLLYINNWSPSMKQKGAFGITDSQSTRGYPCSTVILSSECGDGDHDQMPLSTEKHPDMRVTLQCCQALLRVICWDVDKKCFNPSCKIVADLHTQLVNMLGMYDQ